MLEDEEDTETFRARVRRAGSTTDKMVDKYLIDRGLKLPVVVRRVDPAFLRANGGVLPFAALSTPVSRVLEEQPLHRRPYRAVRGFAIGSSNIQ